MSLTVPELAERLERLRPAVLAAKRREFPRLGAEDLQDAYSQAVEGLLRGGAVFEEEAQVAAYLHRAVANLARNQMRDAARRGASLEESGDRGALRAESGPDLADVLLAAEARVLLSEFLAELAKQDRTIAFLRLYPAYECTPRQIARELGIPYREVRGSLRRTSVNLSRFQALLIRPSALCQRRRADVLEWQRTGVVPLPLRIHLSHCASCRAQCQTARATVRHALLPLLPASAVPLARAGVISRLWHAIGAHPVTQRVDDALSRWRKIAPVGGGGATAIAAKLATAGAVATVGAALHAMASDPPAHPHHTARAAVHHRSHKPVAHLPIHRLNLTPGSSPGANVVTTTASRPVVHAPIHTTTTTSTTAALPPPPNANPLPASSARHTSGEEHAARASATTSTTSSSQSSGGTVAYAPPPNENNVTSAPTSSSHASSGASSSPLPAPGGPPAP